MIEQIEVVDNKSTSSFESPYMKQLDSYEQRMKSMMEQLSSYDDTHQSFMMTA